MKPEVTSTCQVCGTQIPAGLDFCPVCALVRAGGHDSAPSEALDPASDSERNSAETAPASRTAPRPHAPRIVRRFENYEVMLDQDGQPIELGRGAMGITYKAFDIDLRFPMTLKVISEKYVGDESARLRFSKGAVFDPPSPANISKSVIENAHHKLARGPATFIPFHSMLLDENP